MKYIDLHCDTVSVLADHPERGNLAGSDCSIDIGKLQRGDSFLQDFALFVDLKSCGDPWERYQFLLEHYNQEMNANETVFRRILSAEDLALCEGEKKIGSLLSVEEGGVFGGSLDKLEQGYRDGVRLVTLTWNYPNELAWPNGMEGHDKGLNGKGWEFIEFMEAHRMIVDTSHLNDRGTEEILKRSGRPPVASHSDSRAVTDVPRNLPDRLIRLYGDKGGLIGLNFSRNFIGSEPVASLPGRTDIDFSKGPVSCTLMKDIIRHARRIIDQGGKDVICLGTDFDGIEPFLEVKDASDMPKLADAFSAAGFSDELVERIFWKNAYRYLEENL